MLVNFFNQTGMWLADETPFNDDYPLWFSESSHCISPLLENLQLRRIFEGHFNFRMSSLIVFHDQTNIVNSQEIWSDWKKFDITLCMASKDLYENDMEPMENFLSKWENQMKIQPVLENMDTSLRYSIPIILKKLAEFEE